MVGFRALNMGAKAALLAGGAAVAALAGYGGWMMRQAPPPEAVTAAEKVAAVPAVVAAETVAPAATVAIAPAATIMPELRPELRPEPATTITPSFDVVRVEPDGSTVVAGNAQPGSKIVLRVDGVEISATTADDKGNFVGLFVLESSAVPRMLTMISILPDQTEIAADAEVALAPTEAPVVFATAEPETETSLPEPVTASPNPTSAVAPKAPSALLITKDGVKILQSGEETSASDTAATLTIDTISYTPTGEVQLSGRAAAGATLRIYLDNAPLIDLQVGENGLWAATMPPIAPGIYTLRSDQLAADGTVTSRFETPFKRETQDALAAATKSPDPAVQVAVADLAPSQTARAAETPAEPPAESSATATAEPATTTPKVDLAPVAVAEAAIAPELPPTVSITVQPGFTLWGIASKQFGDGVLYVQVYQANKDKIRDPNLIYPGQVFVIPKPSP